MQAVFKIAQVYTTIVPTYPGSWWAFTIASDAITPSKLRISKLKEKIKRFNLSFKYYNPKIHSQAFVLPTLLESIIQGELIYGLFKDKKLIWEEEELSLG
jgi:spermidine synthase